MIFNINGFRTIIFIFIVISTTFRSICPSVFFGCFSNSWTYMELRTTSFIESMGVTCSDSVSHNWVQVLTIPVLLLACSQDITCNPQMIDMEPTPVTVTLSVLLDSLEWIFGCTQLNVKTDCITFEDLLTLLLQNKIILTRSKIRLIFQKSSSLIMMSCKTVR